MMSDNNYFFNLKKYFIYHMYLKKLPLALNCSFLFNVRGHKVSKNNFQILFSECFHSKYSITWVIYLISFRQWKNLRAENKRQK